MKYTAVQEECMYYKSEQRLKEKLSLSDQKKEQESLMMNQSQISTSSFHDSRTAYKKKREQELKKQSRRTSFNTSSRQKENLN